MDEMIAYGVTAVLGMGGIFAYYKKSKVLKVAKEMAEVISIIMSSLKDGKLTAKEVKTMKKEIMDVVTAFKSK